MAKLSNCVNVSHNEMCFHSKKGGGAPLNTVQPFLFSGGSVGVSVSSVSNVGDGVGLYLFFQPMSILHWNLVTCDTGMVST